MSPRRLLLVGAMTTAALTTGLAGQSSIASASVGSSFPAPTAGVAQTNSPAAPSTSPGSTKTILLLTVAHGEAGAPVSRATVLTCDPAGGSHPAAVQACGELKAAGGNIAAISEDSGPCIMIYDPVSVTATGWWQGRSTSYRATYANSCVLHRQTRTLFRF